jgi:hypothetical protein
MAESGVRGTVEIWESFVPLIFDLIKYFRWNRELRGASVNNGRE